MTLKLFNLEIFLYLNYKHLNKMRIFILQVMKAILKMLSFYKFGFKLVM